MNAVILSKIFFLKEKQLTELLNALILIEDTLEGDKVELKEISFIKKATKKYLKIKQTGK